MSRVLTDILTYLVFLVLLMVVAYGNRSPNSHNLYHGHQRALVNGDYGNSNFSLRKVRDRLLIIGRGCYKMGKSWVRNIPPPSQDRVEPFQSPPPFFCVKGWKLFMPPSFCMAKISKLVVCVHDHSMAKTFFHPLFVRVKLDLFPSPIWCPLPPCN